MKKFFSIFLIIFVINLTLVATRYATPTADCKKYELSPSGKLRQYLFCEYQSWSLTAIDTENGTAISLGLAPRIASFDEEKGNLEIFGWLFMSWEDPHLSWHPESYDDIRFLRVRAYAMWQPEIVALTGGNEDSNKFGLAGKDCALTRSGTVICVPQVRHTIRCKTDFTQWPFDRQNCTLVYSTWLRSAQQIHFVEKAGQSIVMDFFEPNGDWILTASRVFYDHEKSEFSHAREATASRVSIDFILDRVHNQLSGRFISPAIIMMVLTLTTLWLDPNSIERLSLACVNPLIHLFSLQTLHWTLPHNGTTVPNLLLFYAYSLILATMALFLTFVMGKVKEMKIEPPTWMSTLTATILRSKVGQILLLSMLDPKVAAEVEPNSDDSGNLMSSNAKTSVWGYVVIMCGWISFITFFFTYIIMYAVLIPNSSMRLPIAGLGIFHYFD